MYCISNGCFYGFALQAYTIVRNNYFNQGSALLKMSYSLTMIHLRRIAALLFIAIFAPCLVKAQTKDHIPKQYDQQYRPQFHFTPAQNWTNDPNGLVYFNGEYHLFFQYNPFGHVWGHMSWGHAVSRDLVHWKQLSVALKEADGVMIFSGSAVVDWNNTSGFGKNGKTPLVAIYTGYHPKSHLQDERIAYSLDNGRTWTKYSGNPVLNINSDNFRDPKVFWYQPDHHWIMILALSDQHKVSFYSSNNLKNWTHLSDFGPKAATGGVWECPMLQPMEVDGNPHNIKWVLEVGLNPGSIAGGSGGQYFIGNFDGKKFTATQPTGSPGDSVLWVDYGKDFYAATSWSDVPKSDGRTLWLGWLDNWQYGQKAPTSPWRGGMSVPRSVGLKTFPDGTRLVQNPVKELQKLRYDHHHLSDITISGKNDELAQRGIRGDVLEIDAVFNLGSASEFGFLIRKGESQQTVAGYNVDHHQMYVDRTHSGADSFSKDFPGVQHGPLQPDDNTIRLHILVDRSSVEVFGNDGQTVITDKIFPNLTSNGLQLFSKGGDVHVRSLDIWKLKSIWSRKP
ncbi:MAG TPA: glycoside hydrolase family 32 protein [Balneolales bacterium]|nr:glycoside hydrolase family 32 protein [Balneolales bacterium]